MAFINEATGDIHFKILYIGSQNSGKTTNLQYIFCESFENEKKRNNTEVLLDLPRNTFFDFLPVSYGAVADRNARMHLYTLPSHQIWPSVNISLMLGVDGIVNVIDSRVRYLDKYDLQLLQVKKLMESLQIDYNSIPFVYQFNHTDSYDALPFSTLKKNYQFKDEDCFEAIASQGVGVMPTFLKIADKIIQKII
jgi:signal recognition particle receptor subunit beta